MTTYFFFGGSEKDEELKIIEACPESDGTRLLRESIEWAHQAIMGTCLGLPPKDKDA